MRQLSQKKAPRRHGPWPSYLRVVPDNGFPEVEAATIEVPEIKAPDIEVPEVEEPDEGEMRPAPELESKLALWLMKILMMGLMIGACIS